VSRNARIFLATSTLLALSSHVCGAAYPTTPGIDLAWHDCIGMPGAAQNLVYACDGSRDGQPFRLVVMFTPQSDLMEFVGVQVVIDMRTESPQLPDWWRLSLGECREGMLAFPGSRTGIGNESRRPPLQPGHDHQLITGVTTCIDPWLTGRDSTGGGFAWYSETRDGIPSSPGRGVLKLAFAQARSTMLQKGLRYLIPPILLDPSNPEDPNVPGQLACPGCAAPGCLVVNQVELYQIAGQTPPQQDIYILNAPIDRLFVTWQGGAIGGDGCPLALPARRATWGAIKAIYR